MRRIALVAAVLWALVALAACGSSRQAYSGRMYSVQQVQQAFWQLGLKLRSAPSKAPNVVSLRVTRYVGDTPYGHGGTALVATQPSAVGGTPYLPGQVTRYANVTMATRPYDRDEIHGALAALRWGTLAQAKPARHLIVLGGSIGPIRLGESRRRVEKLFGRGTPAHAGSAWYFGHRLLVSYEWHDAIHPWVTRLDTSWPGYRTRSDIHVGSSPRDLRRIFVTTCASRGGCYLLGGPWPDALATSFTMRHGRVVRIDMGNA